MFANPYVVPQENTEEMKLSLGNIKPRWRNVQLRPENHSKGMYLKHIDGIKQQQLRNMVSLPIHSMAPFTFCLM